MATLILFTSSPANGEAALRSCGTIPACLFYVIATVFQLIHGGYMMNEMRKPAPTVLPMQGNFNLLPHVDMV